MSSNNKTLSTNHTDRIVPAIYVSCGSSEERGLNNGRWIRANQSSKRIHKEIRQMLAENSTTGAKFYRATDSRGFYCMKTTSFENAAYARFIERYRELGARLLNQYHSNFQCEIYGEDLYSGLQESNEVLDGRVKKCTMQSAKFALKNYYKGTYENIDTYIEKLYLLNSKNYESYDEFRTLLVNDYLGVFFGFKIANEWHIFTSL